MSMKPAVCSIFLVLALSGRVLFRLGEGRRLAPWGQVLGAAMGMRVSAEEELDGMDVPERGTHGYPEVQGHRSAEERRAGIDLRRRAGVEEYLVSHA